MNENSEIESNPAPISSPQQSSGGARKIVIGAVIAAVAVGIVLKGYSAYSFGRNHVETDNAYLTGDLVGISPTVSGTLAELDLKDGDFVKKGQLLARLDSSGLEAELAQAKANLAASLSQVPQAQSALAFEKLSTEAAIQRSNAAVATQVVKTQGSRLQVELSSDTVKSELLKAQGQLEQAQAEAAEAKAGIATARAGLDSARQAVGTAEKNASAQKSMIGAAQADSMKANQDFKRYEKLLQTEAITRQEYDTAVASLSSANANLESMRSKSDGAASQVEQAKSAVAQAQAMLLASQRQFEASQKQIQVAEAGVMLARSGHTNVGIQNNAVKTNQVEQGQEDAELATAHAGLQQVALREKQITTAEAQVEQARASVRQAEIRVRDASLYAPCDGFVVKHTVNVGTAINPGQNVATITRGSDLWVMANFKETQLSNVREGQPVSIEVDAFPGITFRGKVLNIIRATGSATTLLPPDNSTGNFTKVVQRVPVKISVERDASDKAPLSMGMSAVVTVDTANSGQ